MRVSALFLLMTLFFQGDALDLKGPGCGALFRQKFVPYNQTTFGYTSDPLGTPPLVGSGSAWCPSNLISPALVVDLGVVGNISGVETQGQDYKVGSYYIDYALASGNFITITNSTGQDMLFQGPSSVEPELTIRQHFDETIRARYIRFRLNPSGQSVCLKFDILGCIKVDGDFSGWTDWTHCSHSCGGGKRSRVRTCSQPKPANGGKECIGKIFEEEECNVVSCHAPGLLASTSPSGIADWMWILLWLLAALISVLMIIICCLCCCYQGCMKKYFYFSKEKKKTTVIKNYYHGGEDGGEESGDEVQSIVLELREETEESPELVTFCSDKHDMAYYNYGLYEDDKIDDTAAIYDQSRKVFEYNREDDTGSPYL